MHSIGRFLPETVGNAHHIRVLYMKTSSRLVGDTSSYG
eukprot:SAG31_NODE_133_length_23315_cov_4.858847_1_plen_38_part_10